MAETAIRYLIGDFYSNAIDFKSQALKSLDVRDPLGTKDAEN